MAGPILNNTSRPGPAELYERNKTGELVRLATEEGMNLSGFLEKIDPSDDNYSGEDRKLDAFGRQLKVAGIRTRSLPAAGIWADKFEVFDREGNRALMHEFIARRWREVRFGQPANPNHAVASEVTGRSIYTSVDEGLGTIFRPYFDLAGERSSRLQARIPLSRIIALTTPIVGDTYRAAYMSEPSDSELRMVRVPELGEIPLTKITSGEQDVTILKYGRGFESSYEALRRTRIDKVTFWVQRAAIRAENDKFATALDTAINGDGNSNAATNHNLTVLDTDATAGTLTYLGWLQFKEQFGDSYMMDIAITTAALKPHIFLLDVGTGNVMAQTLSGLGAVREMGGRFGDIVTVESHSSAPANKIVGIDTSSALEHVVEIGSRLSETMKFITRQSDVIVMTEVEGFAVLDKLATRILTVNA